jgi:hypothetical protein
MVSRMADFNGILGLDPRSTQEIYYQRSQERQKALMESIGQMGYRDPASASAAQFGGMLGLALGQKIMPGGALTPQDKQAIAIKDRANAIFTQKVQDNPDMSDEDKALTMQMAAADSYREHGVYDRYNALVLDASQRKRARAQAEAQQELLQAEVTDISNKSIESTVRANKALAGDNITFFLPGEDALTAEPKTGKVHENGDVEYTDNHGNTKWFNDYIPADTAIAIANAKRLSKAAGAKGPITTPNKLWTETERTLNRESAIGIIAQAKTVDKIGDTLATMMQQGLNPNVAINTPGSALKFASNLVSGLKAASDYAGTIVDKATGKVVFSGSLKNDNFMDQMRQDPLINAAIQGIQVPEALRGTPQEALYRSMMTQLAYSVWRSMEGAGARNASNQDFANALNRIGGSSGDIKSLFAALDDVLSDNLNRVTASFNGAKNLGKEALGWTPQMVDTYMFQSSSLKAQKAVHNTRNRLRILTGQAPLDVAPEDWRALTKEEQTQFMDTLRSPDDSEE